VKKIHFVCIGNCCRSQMAEGFANHYGKDVLVATSSGLAPTEIVARETIDTMLEKNIDISQQYPKRFDPLVARAADLIVNMSGFVLPGRMAVPIEEWTVHDPFRESMEVYMRSATQVEMKVMGLILRLRRQQSAN
jgi:arsenate reductase (thioredoxin)